MLAKYLLQEATKHQHVSQARVLDDESPQNPCQSMSNPYESCLNPGQRGGGGGLRSYESHTYAYAIAHFDFLTTLQSDPANHRWTHAEPNGDHSDSSSSCDQSVCKSDGVCLLQEAKHLTIAVFAKRRRAPWCMLAVTVNVVKRLERLLFGVQQAETWEPPAVETQKA